jgi:hypothetical protein
LAILTELPEITDTLFLPNKSLVKAIDDANEWFEYLIISDFPDETPKSCVSLYSMLKGSLEAFNNGIKNRITLVHKLPLTDDGLLATNKLLEQVILLVDILAAHKFRAEV